MIRVSNLLVPCFRHCNPFSNIWPRSSGKRFVGISQTYRK